MSYVRNFMLSMLCLLASGQYTCGLRVSLQNLDLGVTRSDLHTRQSSSANASVLSQNLTMPPNPFIFESIAGYFAVYIHEGMSIFPSAPASLLIESTMLGLENRRRAERKDVTSPIPGASVLAARREPGFGLTWGINQEGLRVREPLSYQHAEIALQGTEDVIRQYEEFVRQYAFSLYKTRSMQLVAKGFLKRIQDAVTD